MKRHLPRFDVRSLGSMLLVNKKLPTAIVVKLVDNTVN